MMLQSQAEPFGTIPNQLIAGNNIHVFLSLKKRALLMFQSPPLLTQGALRTRGSVCATSLLAQPTSLLPGHGQML